MKKSFIVGLLILLGSNIQAQKIPVNCNSQHSHVVLQGDWSNHKIIMCGMNECMVLFPKHTLVFGSKLNSYRMIIGYMLYEGPRFRLPRQPSDIYESAYEQPDSR